LLFYFFRKITTNQTDQTSAFHAIATQLGLLAVPVNLGRVSAAAVTVSLGFGAIPAPTPGLRSRSKDAKVFNSSFFLFFFLMSCRFVRIKPLTMDVKMVESPWS
jgi:hypothetical protein